MEKIELTTVYTAITNGGDGSAYNTWFLTLKEAEVFQENQDEGFGEDCTEGVETYVGSNIYKEALACRVELEIKDITNEFSDGIFTNISENNIIIYGSKKEIQDDLEVELIEYNSNFKIKFKG